MNEQEKNILLGTDQAEAMWINPHIGSRTLAYGYDFDRNTVHTYCLNGYTHCLVYNGEAIISHIFGEELPFKNIIPSKRVYWKRSSYDFFLEARVKGIPFSFIDGGPTEEPLEFGFVPGAMVLGLPTEVSDKGIQFYCDGPRGS